MKQEVSLPVLIGIIAAIVVILGFIGWQVFGTRQAGGGAEQLKAAHARRAKRGE